MCKREGERESVCKRKKEIEREVRESKRVRERECV